MPGRDGALRKLGEALVRMPRAGAWVLVFAWYGLITWASSMPGSAKPQPAIAIVLFNSAHAPVFGLLAAWMSLLVARKDGWPDLRAAARLALLAAVLACGIVDELHQRLTPGRDLSVLDLLTDLVGATATLAIVAYLGRPERSRAGLAARVALAGAASIAAGALSTFLPRCFPGVAWF